MDQASNRAHFKMLAESRIREAKALLTAGMPEGAYYLAGYAVECGLKACICQRRMKKGQFPDRDFARAVYTHDLEGLVRLANLGPERDDWTDTHPQFKDRWAVVKEWSEEARYTMTIDLNLAKSFVTAVAAPKLGVLTWLKKYW